MVDCVMARTTGELPKGTRITDLVRQEFHGFLLAHFAIRGLMHEAALKADVDPGTISFVYAVRVVRRKHPKFPAFPPGGEEGIS